mmetsp:Transcript_53157/g.124507  ORF Transcript_53157/g.124507 Transcript_53157/m.124507 type:complete len:299 (+) Transcript_53157:1535-2431(+)
MGVGNDGFGILGHPLLGAGGRLGQLPFVGEQVVEEVVAPLRRRLGPGHLQAAGDGVLAVAAAEAAVPAQALGGEVGALGLDALVVLGRGAVGLAEGMAAGNQRDDLLVVHRHAAEGGADIGRRGEVVAAGIGAFGIHIDQSHVRGGEVGVQLTLAVEAPVVGQPGGLLPPVHVLVGLPAVLAAAGKAEGAKAHALQRDIAGQDEEVGPGDGLAVFLLDRPQQAAALVDVDVVGPGVQRRKALLAAPAAAAAVLGAVGAGGVPGHAHHLRAVVAEVGGPPGLAVGHQPHQVGLEGVVVQ